MSLPTNQDILEKLEEIENELSEIHNEMPKPVGKIRAFISRYHYVIMMVLFVFGYTHKWKIIDRIISIMP